jgi:hypothetical protein
VKRYHLYLPSKHFVPIDFKMSYGRNPGEFTKDWLERLIAEAAPADIRADVQAILQSEETLLLKRQPGKFRT